VTDEEVPAGRHDDELAAGRRTPRFRDKKVPVRKAKSSKGSPEAVEAFGSITSEGMKAQPVEARSGSPGVMSS
jgi:hypothetical protein